MRKLVFVVTICIVVISLVLSTTAVRTEEDVKDLTNAEDEDLSEHDEERDMNDDDSDDDDSDASIITKREPTPGRRRSRRSSCSRRSRRRRRTRQKCKEKSELKSQDKVCWTHRPAACVKNDTIGKHEDKSVDECKQLCSGDPTCLAIKYYKDDGGGSSKKGKPKDCVLKDSNDTSGCDGQYDNNDLYVKTDCAEVAALIEACLKDANSYRQKHQNTPNLRYDEKLATNAQRWADAQMSEIVEARKTGRSARLQHDPDVDDEGENIYYESGYYGKNWKGGTLSSYCQIADKRWYEEIKDYSFSKSKSKDGRTVRLFTQMVWKKTKQVGYGLAVQDDPRPGLDGYKIVVLVARYKPAGKAVEKWQSRAYVKKPLNYAE